MVIIVVNLATYGLWSACLALLSVVVAGIWLAFGRRADRDSDRN